MPSNPNTPGSNRSTTGTTGATPAGTAAGGTTTGSASTGASAAGARDTQDAQDTGRSIKDKAATKAREAGAQVKEQAGEKLSDAKQQAMSRIRDGKSRVADQVGTVAHAFRSAGSDLRNEDQARLAEFTEGAAERIDRVARYIDDRTVGELLDDVEQIARRSPALFLGGAFTLGLLGARFLKTSERRRVQENSGTDSYGAGARTLPPAGETSGNAYGGGYTPASSRPGTSGLSTAPTTGGANA